MSRKFILTKDPYGEGCNLYKRKTIEIKPGVTVLLGCNGIGKTTLLKEIQSSLKKEKIPFVMFDNLHDGGSYAISEAAFLGNFGFMGTAICSSEGENIVMNISNLAARLGHFVKTGDDPKDIKHNRLVQSIVRINKEEIEESEIPKERWILLDAVDSGLSVDNIVDVKEQLFGTILEYNYGNEIYIVVSANEYEMARNEKCFDVCNGKYVSVKDYEEYRSFVLKSKEWKNGRSVRGNIRSPKVGPNKKKPRKT